MIIEVSIFVNPFFIKIFLFFRYTIGIIPWCTDSLKFMQINRSNTQLLQKK